MSKWIILLSLIFTSLTVVADINSDVGNCLGSGSSAAGSKTLCIQNAFAQEMKKQIATVNRTYADTTNTNLKYYGSTAGANTPGGTPGVGAAGGVGTQNYLYAPPPSQNQIQPPPPPTAPVPPGQSPGATTVVPQPKPSPGGIQYY